MLTPTYQYTIKPNDTLGSVIHKLYGIHPANGQFVAALEFVMALNPQITRPSQIAPGTILRIDEYHPKQQSILKNTSARFLTGDSTIGLSNKLGQSRNMCTAQSINSAALPQWKPALNGSHQARGKIHPIDIHPQDHDHLWAATWLEHNTSLVTLPGGATLASIGNLSNPANVGVIEELGDLHAERITTKMSRNRYRQLRRHKLKQLQHQIGPMENLLFGKQSSPQALRIAQGGGIPATAHITRHAEKLKQFGRLSKAGGIALTGVGLTASCMQIAHTASREEKNEILVETIMSTAIGSGIGIATGLFLVSNPVGWGAAVVLAVGATAVGYTGGKVARVGYSKFGANVDFVDGLGVDAICH